MSSGRSRSPMSNNSCSKRYALTLDDVDAGFVLVFLVFLVHETQFWMCWHPKSNPQQRLFKENGFKIMIPITTANFHCSAAFDFTFGFCVCDDIHEVVTGL